MCVMAGEDPGGAVQTGTVYGLSRSWKSMKKRCDKSS